MNFGRIFANAIARRVAYVLVGLVCLWLGLGDAKAQNCSHSYTVNSDACPDQGSAYAAVWAAANQQIQVYKQANPNDLRVACYNGSTATAVTVWIRVSGSCSGAQHKLYTRTFPASTACSNRPNSTFSSDVAIPTGSSGCSNGCEYDVASNGDGTYTRYYSTAGNTLCSVLPDCSAPGWYLNHATSLCQPPNQECAANQIRNSKTGQCEQACPSGQSADASGVCKPTADDCPPGNIKSPDGKCLPGEGQCAAGEAKRPNGTCGRDSDGDGEADEDDDDPENDPDKPTASGGDTCDVPPSCSGGPIDCLQAKIQWRIDCNTRSKVNITGGACGAMPVCVGENCKAMEYSQLLMQWRTACALEKLKLPAAGEGGDGEKIKPDFEALAAGGDGADPGDSIFLPDGDGESFNEGLVSYAASSLGWNFTVEGQQFTMPQLIKDWLPAIRWLIIAGATLVGIGIAWGKL